MFRPVASSVSALSSIVANGHQTLHFVSSAPSEIPYGGFSPVRLQTRLTPRPPSRTCPRPLIGRHCRYLVSRRFVRSRSCDQSAPRTSDHDRESSGPWLPVRLYCPVGSSLTMATSAPLSAAQRIMVYAARLRDQPASPTEGPQFTLPILAPHAVAPTPVVPATACDNAFVAGSAFATFGRARQPQGPTSSGPRGSFNEAAAFTSCYGLGACSPRSGQGFYDRASMGRVTPRSHVGYN